MYESLSEEILLMGEFQNIEIEYGRVFARVFQYQGLSNYWHLFTDSEKTFFDSVRLPFTPEIKLYLNICPSLSDEISLVGEFHNISTNTDFCFHNQCHETTSPVADDKIVLQDL